MLGGGSGVGGGVGEGLGCTGRGGQLSRSLSKDDVEMLLRSVAAEVVQFDCFFEWAALCFQSRK